MSLYYFDLRSADSFSQDPDGTELPDVEAAHEMAVGALADALREAAIEDLLYQRFAVEVRNGIGPVLEVTRQVAIGTKLQTTHSLL